MVSWLTPFSVYNNNSNQFTVRILLASVTSASPEILTRHLDSIRRLTLPKGCSLDFAYVTDPECPEASLRLLDAISGLSTFYGDPKPEGAEYEIGENTHHWTKPTFYWLADQKEFLLRKAEEELYDAIFFVDSDLILDEGTLSSLITSKKDVVSAVFWTRWTLESPPLPQVWMTHPYEFQGKGVEAHEFLRRLTQRELIRVGGLGACTLIRSDVFEKLSWLPVAGLPEDGMWQGEDRHFCVRASRNHVELWADAWSDVLHLYREEDLERVPKDKLVWNDSIAKYKWTTTQALQPAFGDLVSLVLETTEEKVFAGRRRYLRGRLGALNLLPAIEDAILEMAPGEDRLVRVRFPMWWDMPKSFMGVKMEAYAGKTKSILVRLLDAKPWGLAPTLDAFEREPEFLFDEFYEEER